MATRLDRLARERYARRFAQQALRGAARNPGITYADVGRRLPSPKDASSVAHDVTDRVPPELHETFRLLIGLCGTVDGVSARRFAELAMETVEIRELLEAEPEKLIRRGCHLMAARHSLNMQETRAGELGAGSFPDDLRAEAWPQIELAEIYEILRDVHGVDLAEEYRLRGAAA